jgi:hypothetical protein
MRVLVVGTEPVGVRRATEELRSAGYDVVLCHEEGEAAFPCAALRDDRGCPLEQAPVDVVLDVHADGTPVPSAYEDGVACGVREHLPLVVAGAREHPYARWVTEEATGDADVVAACEVAAAAPSAAHGAVAVRAARESLEHSGIDPKGTAAAVHRRDGCLLVMLTLPPHPEGIESMVVARVVSAVRAHDDRARGIDVTIT